MPAASEPASTGCRGGDEANERNSDLKFRRAKGKVKGAVWVAWFSTPADI